MQAEFTLTQLDPVSKHLVIVDNLIGQFTDVSHIAAMGRLHLVENAVDKRCDRIDERHLGPLLEVSPLAVLHPEAHGRQLLSPLFENIVGNLLVAGLAVHVIEEPEREEQKEDGSHNGSQHDVELNRSLLVLTGTRLELAILSRGLLQVEVEVAVIVALGLIIDSRISHTELFADRSHQVGSLVDRRVRECLFEIVKCRLIVAYLSEAGSQRTISTSNLIDIAIAFEEIEGILCEVASKHILAHPFGIHLIGQSIGLGKELHGRHIVTNQLMAILGHHEMFGKSLNGISSEIGIIGPSCQEETAHQMVELLLVDLLLGSLSDDATRPDVIEIVQELCRIADDLIGINRLQGINRLSLETYIIIIGGVDNGVFGLCIEQHPSVALREQRLIFLDTHHGQIGQFTILMELPVTRTSLTETHLLDIGHQELELVISNGRHLVEQAVGPIVLHPDDAGKSHMIECLCLTIRIMAGLSISS